MEFLLKGRQSWPLQVAVWLISFYVAWNIVPAGYGKLMDIAGTTAYFESLGFAPFLVYVVGVLQIAGPLMMFIPRLAFYGAVPTSVIMFVASYVVGWENEMISYVLALAILPLLIAIATRPSFLRKKPVITKISI